MKILLWVVLILINPSRVINDDFLSQQKKYVRVRTALANKGQLLDEDLKKVGLNRSNLHILITIYKEENELIVFAKEKSKTSYSFFKSYPICASSGTLGPKRKSGDLQVPEGYYLINRFNPNSNFHLSLGINYPNASDQILTSAIDPGGDIFIHGSCVTIGCVPMTDAYIEEIYLLSIFSRNNNQLNIPVYIYPFKMTKANMEKYSSVFSSNPALIQFWKNLQLGYQLFENSKKQLTFSVNNKGQYVYNQELD